MSRAHGPNAERRRRIKRQLALRDGEKCFYCDHRFAALAEATIDHLIPHSVLPTWIQANLVLACYPCNQAKADRLPQELIRPAGYGPGLTPRPAHQTAHEIVSGTAFETVSGAASVSVSPVRDSSKSSGNPGAHDSTLGSAVERVVSAPGRVRGCCRRVLSGLVRHRTPGAHTNAVETGLGTAVERSLSDRDSASVSGAHRSGGAHQTSPETAFVSGLGTVSGRVRSDGRGGVRGRSRRTDADGPRVRLAGWSNPRSESMCTPLDDDVTPRTVRPSVRPRGRLVSALVAVPVTVLVSVVLTRT